jgi:DNA-binding MarR family transcriptional regulator
MLAYMHASAAPAQVSPAELAQELNRLWMHLMRQGTPRLYAVLDELEISMAHVKALHALAGTRCELSVKDYAEHIGCSLPNASRMAEALLKRGFAERREDPDDRRIRRLRITEAGQDAVRRIDTARLEGLEAYTSGMTPEQRSALHAALVAIPYADTAAPEPAR